MKLKSIFLKLAFLTSTVFIILPVVAQVKYYAFVSYCANRDFFDDESIQINYISKPIDITKYVEKYDKSNDTKKKDNLYDGIIKLFNLKLYAQYKIELPAKFNAYKYELYCSGLEYIYGTSDQNWNHTYPETTIGKNDIYEEHPYFWSFEEANKYYEYMIIRIKAHPNWQLKIVE